MGFAVVALMGGGVASAASYVKTDGTIVDPIQNRYGIGGDSPYSGADLESGANLASADLRYAYLEYANLHNAELVLGVAHDDIAANETLLGNIHNSKPTRWGRSRQP